MQLDGYYINLDSATRRRSTFEKHFAEMGFSDSLLMRRFPAIVPSAQEVQHFSEHLPAFLPGHMGCFLSHKAVLQYKIANNDGTSDLLVVEDDTLFSPRTEFFLNQAFQWLEGKKWDLLYTDFITQTQADKTILYEMRLRYRTENTMAMLDLSHYGFTGLSCYIVNKQSLHKYKAVLDELNPVNQLIDWHILNQVNAGNLIALAIFPHITTVNGEADHSTIDGGIPLSHFNNFVRRHLWIDAPHC